MDGNALPEGDYLERSSPVGWSKYPVNEFGLFDTHGNVWEWCEDWYSESSRVLRGGSWRYNAEDCRSAHRDYLNPVYRVIYHGFRLCRLVSSPVTPSSDESDF